MSARRPPPAAAPDDDDEKADENEGFPWSRFRTWFILIVLAAVLALVIAELVVAVQDRHLADRAFGDASTANETAAKAVDAANEVSISPVAK